ncbi:MAG: hypothetical protein Q4E13_03075 [Clostridia bacterium]|nr:hypothetical protein [Clostridia bacterium]
MNEDLFNRLRTYSETIAIVKRLLEAGLISYKEFLMLENQTAKQNGLLRRSIFREIT